MGFKALCSSDLLWPFKHLFVWRRPSSFCHSTLWFIWKKPLEPLHAFMQLQVRNSLFFNIVLQSLVFLAVFGLFGYFFFWSRWIRYDSSGKSFGTLACIYATTGKKPVYFSKVLFPEMALGCVTLHTMVEFSKEVQVIKGYCQFVGYSLICC